MELIAKGTYHSGLCSLYPGDSTDGRGIPEDVKAQMLKDFPDLFEVVGKPVVAEITIPEQLVVTENQEDKMPKIRKKA